MFTLSKYKQILLLFRITIIAESCVRCKYQVAWCTETNITLNDGKVAMQRSSAKLLKQNYVSRWCSVLFRKVGPWRNVHLQKRSLAIVVLQY